MEMGLKGDTKVKFTQQANLVESHCVSNFTMKIVTMTMHIFLKHAYLDQKLYIRIYLRRPKEMKVRTFTSTSLV